MSERDIVPGSVGGILSRPAESSTTPDKATLLVEIRAGDGDNALIVSRCGGCGAELKREQTELPRAPIAQATQNGDTGPEEALMAHAVFALAGVKRCSCGWPIPGPMVMSRIELPE